MSLSLASGLFYSNSCRSFGSFLRFFLGKSLSCFILKIKSFNLFLRSVAWVWMPGESSVWFLLRLYKKWSPLRIIVLFLNQTIKCISQHWCVTYVWLVYLVFNFVWLGLVWEASIFSTFHAPNQNQHPCQPIQFLHIFPNPTDLYYMQTLFNLALASLKKLLLTVDPKSTSLSYIRCLVVVGFLVWKNDRFHKMVQIEKKRGGVTTQIQSLI